MSYIHRKCDDCGKFMNPKERGSSFATIFDFVQMCPDYDHWRCQKCTEKLGPVDSNARPFDGDMSQYQSLVS